MTSTQKTPGSHITPAPQQSFERITFVASDVPEAGDAMRRLAHQYGNAPVSEADAIVALGGDGLMLQTLHTHMNNSIPIYGMNRGSVGFLMNEYSEDNLVERLQAAHINKIHPLSALAHDQAGNKHKSLAINEVALFRERHQAAKLRVTINDTVRLEELICDGTLIATPAGSTAYNLSANGPILPINAPLLALTPISPFRPRRWRGAILPNESRISIEVLEPKKRPVSSVADHHETRDVIRVDIALEQNIELLLMYDPGHNLDERILLEQFGT